MLKSCAAVSSCPSYHFSSFGPISFCCSPLAPFSHLSSRLQHSPKSSSLPIASHHTNCQLNLSIPSHSSCPATREAEVEERALVATLLTLSLAPEPTAKCVPSCKPPSTTSIHIKSRAIATILAVNPAVMPILTPTLVCHPYIQRDMANKWPDGSYHYSNENGSTYNNSGTGMPALQLTLLQMGTGTRSDLREWSGCFWITI